MTGVPPQNLHDIPLPYAPHPFSARNTQRVKFVNIILMEFLETVSCAFRKIANSNRMTSGGLDLLLIHLFKTRQFLDDTPVCFWIRQVRPGPRPILVTPTEPPGQIIIFARALAALRLLGGRGEFE